MSALDQKITGMRVWHLQVPVNSARDHGIGRVEGACEVVVVELTAEGGEKGWGEASPWVVFTGSPEASFAAIDRYFRPLVVGVSLADAGGILSRTSKAVAHCTEAKAALEAALLDLTGRVSGLPVWALLGGRVRERIDLSVSIANPSWDEDLTLLDRLEEDGIGIVKLKAGFREHAFDILRLEHLRTERPGLRVRVDFNQGLHADEAEERVRDVAAFGPDFIEQPVAADQFDLMSRLRDRIDIPLLADESVFGPEDMMRAVAEGIADGVSIKIMKAGGLVRAQSVARMAAASGMMAYGGDMFETGLAHLAGMHMIAATPEITLGCEFYQSTYYLKEDLLCAPLQIEEGQILVPEGPGLGIEPDPDMIEKFDARRG